MIGAIVLAARCWRGWIAATLCLGLTVTSVAQQPEVYETHSTRMESLRKVQAIADSAIGEQVALQSGTLSFSTVDVSIPGNSDLPVNFGRQFNIINSRVETRGHALGDWEIELPRLVGRFGTKQGQPSWDANGTLQRCTSYAAPTDREVTIGGGGFVEPFQLFDFWNGVRLEMAGGSSEILVPRTFGPNPPAPQGLSHYWLTADGQTHLRCTNVDGTPIGVQNAPGEGFMAVDAAGTKYTFGHMASRPVPGRYRRAYRFIIPYTATLPIYEIALYVTRIEDRFGNWVTYSYANAYNERVRLTEIRANDGRQIDIAYGAYNVVSTVTANGRTWTYRYAQVTLPSGSSVPSLR